jgi:phage tail sheath protein FI
MAFNPFERAPGVFIQEIDVPGPIAGVGTSTAAFIGPAERGPIGRPVKLTNVTQFTNLFGGFVDAPRVYATHAVHGFFRNGGSTCYFQRVGTAVRAHRTLNDRAGQPALVVTALNEGAIENGITVQVQEAHAAETTVARAEAGLAAAEDNQATLATPAEAQDFRGGDMVRLEQAAKSDTVVIEQIAANGTITFATPIANAYDGGTIRLADLRADQLRLRLDAIAGLEPGSYVRVRQQGGNAATGVVNSVDAGNGVVTLAAGLGQTFELTAAAQPVTITSQDFSLTVSAPAIVSSPPDPARDRAALTQTFDHLTMDPRHSRYVTKAAAFRDVEVALPAEPSPTPPPNNLLAAVGPVALQGGKDDEIGALAASHYEAAIDRLRPVDDVNLLCIPDAAQPALHEAVQAKMIDHCAAMEDRFALLDPLPGRDSAGIEAQRGTLASDRGFGALYYPRIVIGNPLAPGTITVPPSGHLAGVFADTDSRVGVFKAPANVAMRGVLGLERVLTDAEQGPLNEKGINVLRAFSGRGVVVWGARTISTRTQWRYVNIRRLLLFIEQSIKRGTQFAVFEPNTIGLRQRVVRQVREFLLRQWQAGALVGATPDEAFRVRADEELNPPDQIALGILTIEVILAPATPAEFVVFRVIQKPGGPVVEE